MTETRGGITPSPVEQALLALVPGALALTACFGWGTLLNLAWAWLGASAAGALLRRLRGGTARAALADRGLWLGAALLALSLPPQLPWWMPCGGAALAAGVLRPLQGTGLRLNPAMAAYVLLLLAFPLAMSRWSAPVEFAATAASLAAPLQALRASLGLLDGASLDAMSMATPLDVLRLDDTHTLAELGRLHPQFRYSAWTWVNVAFLAGGICLAWRRVVPWQLPAALLATLALLAALWHDGGSSASGGSPALHLFAGGTMLGAFFVATDPASCPRSAAARIAYGVLLGALVFAMRWRGHYADGIAIAVLVAGLTVPLLERRVPGGRAPGTTPPHPGRPARWRAPLAALLAAALLWLGWSGPRSEQDAGALPLAELLAATRYDNRPAEDRVAVQDLALLGLTAPRDAYRARRDGKVVAVALPLIAADGYAGAIELMIGIRADGHLTGVRVTRHAETRGYGDALADAAWLGDFAGRAPGDGTRWALRRDGGEFDQFSGATTTPRAVVAAVHRGLRYFEAHRADLLLETGR